MLAASMSAAAHVRHHIVLMFSPRNSFDDNKLLRRIVNKFVFEMKLTCRKFNTS